MSEMPNWFRWLIIIIATLIMCACRAPLQDPRVLPSNSQVPQSVLIRSEAAVDALSDATARGLPLLPPITASPQVTSTDSLALPRDIAPRAAVVTERPAMTTTQDWKQDPQARIIALLGVDPTKQPDPNTSACACGKKHAAYPSTPLAMSSREQPLASTVSPTCLLAPVVKQTNTGLQVQDVPGTVETRRLRSQTSAAKLSTAPRRTAPAVYMRVNDDGVVSPAVAQFESNIGSETLAPIVNPGLSNVDSTLALPSEPMGVGPALPEPVLHEPALAEPNLAQPMFVDGAALPLDMQPQTYVPPSYEAYVPVEEVPLASSPSQWAQDPYAQDGGLNLPQEELARRYPDEYICDGGDANGPAFVLNDWTVRNLDPEDTIGHYDTKAGEVVVAPSNKVCVYAPRFAATRQVTSAFAEEQVEQLLVAAIGSKAFVEEVDQPSEQLDSTISPKRHVLLQPASTFKKRTAGITGIQSKAVNIMAYDVSPHEDFRVLKLGIHKQSEKPRLSEYVAKATTWSKDEAVQVLIDEAIARTNVSRRGAEAFFTIGDNGPAKLRVIKTASKSDALPGEEVEFTLRFDNVGQQRIGNVTIIDNLTTRLEFVDDSDLCSVDATFLVADNDAESLTLRWEVKDPIEPGHGGLIRFRCRVR